MVIRIEKLGAVVIKSGAQRPKPFAKLGESAPDPFREQMACDRLG